MAFVCSDRFLCGVGNRLWQPQRVSHHRVAVSGRTVHDRLTTRDAEQPVWSSIGERRLERPLVRVTPIPEEQVPEDVLTVDSLARPVGRVIKILHSHSVTNGESGSADLLQDDAYVLRRPYELNSRLTADLDGSIVAMDSDGHWAYRVNVTTEHVYEPAYTTLAIEVATTTDAFRDTALAATVDTRLDPAGLDAAVRQLLERVTAQDTYRETTPLSTEYTTLLDVLDLEHVETVANGHHLWYDDTLYRYGLYVTDAD